MPSISLSVADVAARRSCCGHGPRCCWEVFPNRPTELDVAAPPGRPVPLWWWGGGSGRKEDNHWTQLGYPLLKLLNRAPSSDYSSGPQSGTEGEKTSFKDLLPVLTPAFSSFLCCPNIRPAFCLGASLTP